MEYLKFGFIILIGLVLPGCAMLMSSAKNTAIVYADTEILRDSYNGLETTMRANRQLFEDRWDQFEDFDKLVDVMVDLHDDIKEGRIATISLEEVDYLWGELKDQYNILRPQVIAQEEKFSRIHWIGLKAFDFKASEADKSINKLVNGGDATEALNQILEILTVTAKIAAVVAL